MATFSSSEPDLQKQTFFWYSTPPLFFSLPAYLYFKPNQQWTLNKLPTELRCSLNFVNKHRLSKQVQKTCMQCVVSMYILTELPFCIPLLVVGKKLCYFCILWKNNLSLTVPLFLPSTTVVPTELHTHKHSRRNCGWNNERIFFYFFLQSRQKKKKKN